MNKPLTIKQTAQKLKVSETTIRNYINKKKLERKIINGKHHVTAKSIKALINKGSSNKKIGNDKWSRRAFIATIGVAAFSPLYNKVVVDWMEDSFGRDAVQTDIKDLFSYWDELNLFPGSKHPKYLEGSHPDVAEAQNSISKLMEATGKVEFRPLSQCLSPSLNANYLLVGGPISNELSRNLHGYILNNQKISNEPIKTNKFRWHFHYPLPSTNDSKFSRFVRGNEVSTMPKAIVDKLGQNGNKGYLLPQTDTDSDRILKDYLLLTVVENKINGVPTGKHLIDVADLNGQGNKAFAQIMANKERRNELMKAINGKPYFQALYEVKILHDDYNKITSLGEISLIGTSLLS